MEIGEDVGPAKWMTPYTSHFRETTAHMRKSYNVYLVGGALKTGRNFRLIRPATV